MTYPSSNIPETDNLSILFDEEKLNKFIELFPNDGHMERLRLHYLEVAEEVEEEEEKPEEETAQEEEEIKLEHIIPAPELARGETIDAVGLYLKEMSRVPLLTNEEEINLAQRIEGAKKADRKLNKLNGKTPQAEKDTLKLIIADGKAARDHLIERSRVEAGNLALGLEHCVAHASLDVQVPGTEDTLRRRADTRIGRHFRQHLPVNAHCHSNDPVWRALSRKLDVADRPDENPVEPHRRTTGDCIRIVQVRIDGSLIGEETALPRH